MNVKSSIILNKSEALETINEQLIAYHYQFSQEDLLALRKWQTIACQKHQMFDFSSDIISMIIIKMSSSPYLNQASLLQACKDFIFLFYACRKHEIKLMYDEELIELIFNLYLINNGVIDKVLMQNAIKSVQRFNND